MTDWTQVLRSVATRGRADVLDGLADAMPDIIARCSLTTKDRIAGFLGQWAEETDGYRVTEEYASGAAYEGRKDLGNVKRGMNRLWVRQPISIISP